MAHLSAWLVRGVGFSSSLAGVMPRMCSHIHCCTVVSLSKPRRCARTHRPRSSPWCTTSPGDVGSSPPASRCMRVRWKALCHSTGQAGHHDGSISSSCSRRSSDRAPADDFTGRPWACRCSIWAARRAAARRPLAAPPCCGPLPPTPGRAPLGGRGCRHRIGTLWGGAPCRRSLVVPPGLRHWPLFCHCATAVCGCRLSGCRSLAVLCSRTAPQPRRRGPAASDAVPHRRLRIAPARHPRDRDRCRYVHRIPICDSCSIRSGESVAARLRWLLIHAPSFSSRTSWSSPLPSLLRTMVSVCLRGTRRCPSRS